VTTAVVLLSGGKDSAVALWWAKARHESVHALSISHPERPRMERAAAGRLADLAECDLIELDLPFLHSARMLIPGREDDVGTAGVYVPMRNLLIFSVAGYCAESAHADSIVAGQLASDGRAYSDATEEFFQEMAEIFRTSLSRSFLTKVGELSIELPLIGLSDAEAMRLGRELDVPFEATWSCLQDGQEPCLTCVSCRDRSRVLL
jgi:7-cyano-7-deazaguanine synthase